MLRLVLVLSFLTALAVLGISQFMVKPAVDDLRKDAETARSEAQAAQSAKAEADKKAKDAVATADKATKEASQAKNDLATASQEASEQRTRADKLAEELSNTTRVKNEAQVALARWNALGIEPDGINKLKADAKEAREARAAIAEENKILDRKLRSTEARLTRYEGEKTEIELPSGVRGTVTAISPGADFVFLNIGANQGLLEHGKLMVRRGDKLITKVQIVSVAENHAIANVLRNWNQGDVSVQVGDAVLY